MKSVLALVVCALMWLVVGWWCGVSYERGKALQVNNEQLQREFKRGQALGTVRDQIVTQYVDRVQVIKERGATLIKEVPVYVSAKADAACAVNAGFVRVHDAAAHGLPAPEPAGAADDAPSGIALSAVAATTAANYTDCNANAEQLSQLQQYLRAFDNVNNGASAAIH